MSAVKNSIARKDSYRRLCTEETSIPLFMRDWWLDTTCGPENWGVALAQNGDKITGALPYRMRRTLGLTDLGQPPLSAGLGPWLRPLEMKAANRLGHEKDVMTALIDDLPSFGLYQQVWHPEMTNWLPFYWRGFQQTTAYTYILEDLRDEKALWSQMRENIRGDIRKATGRFNVRVRDDIDINAFLDLSSKTFERQGKTLPYSREFVLRLDAVCAARQCRAILVGEDNQGRHHAGAYIVWDENSAYYLMGGGDPELRNSGATSLCMWEAIRRAASVTKRFNFEGSMIEPVERYFRAFGGTLTPRFAVKKINSPLLQLAFLAKKALRR
jgi:hypothetical protein